MKNIQSGSRSVTSVWHFSASRSGLVPVLIYDCLIAYFYYAWEFTDGRQGLPPKYTLAVLIAVHGLQLFVFLLEVVVRTCQWVWANISETVRSVVKRKLSSYALLGLMLFSTWAWFNFPSP